jgi:succinyl-CoA:(S)-malate CoA-transferase subunit A/succinyl-CoA:(S)-malate CoA-transferase subunit B
MDEQTSNKALTGLRVLDLGTFVAAPFCATVLGEFGAEVLKVELPGSGDSLRTLGEERQGIPLLWLQEARNKHTITCNLRDKEGQEIIRDLVRAGYNVVVENFRPGTLERWNLGYGQLKAIDPGLIFARISGYGQDGPAKNLPGFGRIAQAFGGLTYLCGFPDRAPANPGSATIADYLSGLFAAFGILVAERHRAATGQGQIVDVALFESVFRILDSLAITYSVTGKVRERMGTATALAAPHNHFPTRDGKWVAIACTNDRIFARLASVMDMGELTVDPRFSRERDRVANRTDIDRIVEGWTKRHDLAGLISALNQAEIPCSPINSIADIFADTQFAARNALAAAMHPVLGEIKMPAVVPHLSDTPGGINWLGRELGADTDAVLGRVLNYSSERLAQLRERKVI